MSEPLKSKNKYILKGKRIIKVDLMTWAQWFEQPDRILFQTEIKKVKVSTVFIGFDKGLMFETMIFGGKNDGATWRPSTYKQASNRHSRCVKLILQGKL